MLFFCGNGSILNMSCQDCAKIDAILSNISLVIELDSNFHTITMQNVDDFACFVVRELINQMPEKGYTLRQLINTPEWYKMLGDKLAREKIKNPDIMMRFNASANRAWSFVAVGLAQPY